MAVDEATQALLDGMAASGMKPLEEMTVAEARELLMQMKDQFGDGPEMESVADHLVPVADGAAIDVRVLSPTTTPRGTLVYLHGGGWIMGGIEESDTLGRRLAAQTGCCVALVAYRLAPEHPFPVPLEDSWAALGWIAAHRGAEVPAPPDSPLIALGDSSGGNLVAALARHARDDGGPAIALQVLAYPVTDCEFSGPSYLDPENQLLLKASTMRWYWDSYCPDPEARRDPDASPLRAEGLAGLAPAIILTAEHDVLRDEGEAYGERLAAAGVPVRVRRFAGQMHGFLTLLGMVPGSDEGLHFVAAEIEAALTAASVGGPR